ncbi:MAG: NBR1-Ig-like domain-containing protein, partial [Anaerolineales bacterium]
MRKKTNALFTIIVCVGMMLSACNFPFLSSATEEASPEPGSAADQTSVAETVVALQTQESGLPADEETEEPVGEESPEPPTEEAGPSPTPGEEGCIDRVGFVADVTIPDDTFIDPGDSFTKTWRLKNLGTCTWTSSYALVFSHGDQMGGPGSVPLSGTVNPGGTVDLSVNLTAPGSEGTYQGYWMLRNGNGVLFGIGGSGDSPFWVKIKVPGPTP